MTIRRGNTVTVQAERLSRYGEGIALHDDGKGVHEVHVSGLFPGETAEVVIDYVSRQRPKAHGSITTLRSRSGGRRASPCPHHGPCGGCPLIELDLPEQRAAKLSALREHFRFPVDRIVGADEDELHYRWSCKRVVSGEPGDLTLGSYMRGTHRVADMSHCRVDDPRLVQALDEVRMVGNQLGTLPYHEATGRGDLRYVWAKTDARSSVLLTLITAGSHPDAVAELAQRLKIPVGVAWGVQPGRGNDMRGLTVRPLRGRQSLTVDIAGIRRAVGPLGFLQPNPPVAALAYRDLARMPAGGAVRGHRAFDLYAGAGITTDLLREQFTEVLPCEAYPDSARSLGVTPELTEAFLARMLANSRERVPELVVANPPRGGLGPTVCEQLTRLGAARIHLMSCSPRSLRDDLDRLTGDAGPYRLIGVRAYDTLPQTAHIELVAWLVARR